MSNEAATLRAILNNVDRYFQRLDLATIQRRVDGWTDDGFSAGGDGVGRTSSGAGEHSDRTFAKAVASDAPDYRQILRDVIRPLERAEWALGELTRPAKAVTEEKETTHIKDSLVVNVGVCEACGRRCDGRSWSTRLVMKHGPALCQSHATGFARQRNGESWLMIEDYVKSIRNQRGLDLEAS